MAELSDDELLDALGIEAKPLKPGGHTPHEERIIAGFDEIQRFFELNGRAPSHGERCDISERLYAVRLDQLRKLPEARRLLTSMDTHHLLGNGDIESVPETRALNDDALLTELGIDELVKDGDITVLKHVRTQEERRIADDVANRIVSKDFGQFKPLFEQAETDLKAGTRKTVRFGRDASVIKGNFFILSGQMTYVADMGESFRTPNGESDARLRVVFANGTESHMLLRSLQRALYKDEAGRRLSDRQLVNSSEAGPLFSGIMEEGDVESGTVYVLRSLSSHPYVMEHRELLHKIGVTGGKVESRIANAEHDATYMLAKVQIMATYKLAKINRIKLENLIHRIFAPAQLNLTIQDRFGRPVQPQEWFLVPLPVIDEAIQRIVDGTITHYVYDPKAARLVKN